MALRHAMKKLLSGGRITQVSKVICIRNNLLHTNHTSACSDVNVSHTDNQRVLRFGLVADLDEDQSRSPKKPFEGISFFKTGFLTISPHGNYSVNFTDTVKLTSNLNCKGRGMELSELCLFDGKLLAVDDSTGIVFQILNNEPIPWVILPDGNGISTRPFKCEWMARKNGNLFVGSTGKEFTSATTGEVVDRNRMFVKEITPSGAVTHHDWTRQYTAIRQKAGITFPGYMIHEAVEWSDTRQKWLFLPRRMSKERYCDVEDERRGTNVMISSCDEFENIEMFHVGEVEPERGYSSIRFVPGTNEGVMMALKTKEVEDVTATYVQVFDVNTRQVLLPDLWVEDSKYEGLEFF